MSAAAYLDLIAARAELIRRFDASTAGYDALIMPTCPLVPPAIAALDDEDEYNRVNLLQLRNSSAGNFLDRCAISLPCERPGEAPVGLMLMGETLGDARLFAVAAAVEARARLKAHSPSGACTRGAKDHLWLTIRHAAHSKDCDPCSF